jgi:tRNA/tmRNA/rRNA uracil-C5-methylase (TrmA/RlmC/RlmD family)
MGWGIGRVKLDLKLNLNLEPKKEGDDQKDDDNNNDDDRLWVVMVPHVVVGELVQVRIFRNHRGFSEADLIEVLEPSEHRVTPKCSLAGICGGCQYQHMSIEAQRDWKTMHVQEVLLQQQIVGYDTKAAIDVHLHPTMGTEHVYNYRSKLTPHYQAPIEVGVGEYQLREIGFLQSANRNLVDVPECPIATEAINTAFIQKRQDLHEQAKAGLLNKSSSSGASVKTKKRRGGRGGDKGATLLFRHADDDTDGNPVVVTDHNEYMTTTVKDIQFRYLAGNFFQNNNYVLPFMVDAVLEAAIQPIKVDGAPPSYLIDCYCGSGLFALSAASKMNVCVGIEVNARAIEEATENANLNGITNCQFVAASAEAIFTSPPQLNIFGEYDQVDDFPRDQTVVVLDPPRKGCSTEFLEQLYDYSPQRIVYMSCDPATQARDAKGIVEIGGYEIKSIQPFDVFPQTKHIECLVIFEKKNV